MCCGTSWMSRTSRKVIWFAACLFFFAGSTVRAQVLITEIMYDAEGSDADREWVEVWNGGSNSIEAESIKFFENDTNHNLTLFKGDKNIAAGAVFIIAEDASRFAADYPSVPAAIFDSSFSLSNTGERLVIKRDDLILDEVTYSSASGAAGSGKSLQRADSGWVESSPSPGVYVSFSAPPPPPNSSVSTSTPPTPPPPPAPFVSARDSTIKTMIERFEAVGMAGASLIFSGKVLGKEGKLIDNARLVWSFGDGGSEEGRSVMYVYHFPGEYMVILEGAVLEESASDRVRIKVIPPALKISDFKSGEEGFVEITNSSEYELSLGSWMLKSGAATYSVPKNTVILPKSSIKFSSRVTGVSSGLPELLYPNGSPASVFAPPTSPAAPAPPASKSPKSSPLSPAKSQVQKPPPPPPLALSGGSLLKSPETVADTSPADSRNEGTNPVWFIALAIFIALGVASVFLTKKRNPLPEEGVGNPSADDFEIEEDSRKEN